MKNYADYRSALIDTHVHIYDCFSLSDFLSGAWGNFSASIRQNGYEQSSAKVLMLAETSYDHWFQKLSESTDSISTGNLPSAGAWRFQRVPEDPCAILATGPGDESLLLIAGRQVITSENIEVLGLGINETIEDGLPLKDVADILHEHDALVVLPWGVGKWLGRRGRIIRHFVEASGDSKIFVGDIIGRPVFWPRSHIFRFAESSGIKILPGTDPLPLISETARAGEGGIFIHYPISMKQPTRDLKKALRNPTVKVNPYIQREKLFRFARNQISIRR